MSQDICLACGVAPLAEAQDVLTGRCRACRETGRAADPRIVKRLERDVDRQMAWASERQRLEESRALTATSLSCPRCRTQTVFIDHSQIPLLLGLAGALVGGAMARYVCMDCGRLRRREFPDGVASSILRQRLLMIGAALLALVIVAIVRELARP